MSDIKECAARKPYYEYIQKAESVIQFLEYLGGTGPFNPYKETIIRLQGYVSGAKMVERENDL